MMTLYPFFLSPASSVRATVRLYLASVPSLLTAPASLPPCPGSMMMVLNDLAFGMNLGLSMGLIIFE